MLRRGARFLSAALKREFSAKAAAPAGGAGYPGATGAQFTATMDFRGYREAPLPIFRVMDQAGEWVVSKKEREKLVPAEAFDKDAVVNMYKAMVRHNVMDTILYNAQRQGRISFYMTSYGEEALQIGSAAAMNPADEVFAQYREAAILMWRGFTLDQIMNQCYGTAEDTCKGRQMPVHYGSKELHYQTVSSPLATQIPHAAGAGYALRQEGSDRCAITFFGEGAASEGDFHAALNFAATLKSQTVFFCRNNGYAISTPVADQYAGDGIAGRGLGYGIATIRVDGNDLFAVLQATRTARNMCVEEKRPVVIEAMTYRVGHHSTSDDSSRYRGTNEVQHYQDDYNPIHRVRRYMDSQGWWSDDDEQNLIKSHREAILGALGRAEKRPKPGLEDLFSDVYAELPQHLQRQQEHLKAHVAKYKDYYEKAIH